MDALVTEDVPYIDLTCEILGIDDQSGQMEYFTREDCVLAGTEVALRIMAKLGCEVVQSVPSGQCVEAGGPLPGTGCAGRGIITAFEQLDELHAYEAFEPDVVLYDVLGDVVCGGFSLPLRGEHSDVVYVVTSGEMMAMYAASNIAQAVERFKARGYARFGGLVLNRRNVEDEEDLVRKLACELGTEVVGDIPRSSDVHACEQKRCTVMEGAPACEAARAYGRLADMLLAQADAAAGAVSGARHDL